MISALGGLRYSLQMDIHGVSLQIDNHVDEDLTYSKFSMLASAADMPAETSPCRGAQVSTGEHGM
jgi:hypothetical protein